MKGTPAQILAALTALEQGKWSNEAIREQFGKREEAEDEDSHT